MNSQYKLITLQITFVIIWKITKIYLQSCVRLLLPVTLARAILRFLISHSSWLRMIMNILILSSCIIIILFESLIEVDPFFGRSKELAGSSDVSWKYTLEAALILLIEFHVFQEISESAENQLSIYEKNNWKTANQESLLSLSRPKMKILNILFSNKSGERIALSLILSLLVKLSLNNFIINI